MRWLDSASLLDELIILRKRRGITQARLAKELYATSSAVSRLERKITEPRIDDFLAYARVLGLRIEMRIIEKKEAGGEKRLPSPSDHLSDCDW